MCLFRYLFTCWVVVKFMFWPLGGTTAEHEVMFLLTLLVSSEGGEQAVSRPLQWCPHSTQNYVNCTDKVQISKKYRLLFTVIDDSLGGSPDGSAVSF